VLRLAPVATPGEPRPPARSRWLNCYENPILVKMMFGGYANGEGFSQQRFSNAGPVGANEIMSSASGRHTGSSRSERLQSIRWRSWPLVDDLSRTVIVVIGLVAAWVLVRWTTGQTLLALMALVVLAVSLWRFFLPTSYEISDEGLDQWFFGYRRRIHWKAIRRYEIRSAGVLLLPHADRRAVDVFRGLYLPWCERRDEVLAQIASYLGEPAE